MACACKKGVAATQPSKRIVKAPKNGSAATGRTSVVRRIRRRATH